MDAPLAASTNMFAQQVKPCPCEKVEQILAPDTSVLHRNLKSLFINTSYFSWNKYVALGNESYPEDDKNDDYPNNYHTYSFGCPHSIVYDKATKVRFTGELVFTGDDNDRGTKDIVFQRTQLVNGLKDGCEIYYGWENNLVCYYPRLLVFFKKGMIYKKIYAFDYDDGRLLKERMVTFSDGLIRGETKNYDNGLLFLNNGRSFKNREKVVYEANILRVPSSDCQNIESGIYGTGSNTVFPVYKTEVAFEGYRRQFDPGTGELKWEEFWKDDRLQFRNEYYINPPECPQRVKLLAATMKYTYLENGDFIEELKSYFPDCESSVKEIHSTRNYASVGRYERYETPNQPNEKGFYNDTGEKDGVWEIYSYEGKLQERTTYVAGLKHGIQELYDEEGMLFRKLRYEIDIVVEIIK